MFIKLVIIYVGGNFKLLKYYVFYFDVIGFVGMEEDLFLLVVVVLKFEWFLFVRVMSDFFDLMKIWYVFIKELCGGVRLFDFF